MIISACYSGVFTRPLADPNTLIITAADADHSSFGCKDKKEWTYFGDAFFNTALRRTTNLRDAFALASALIRKRELQSGLKPSNPRMAGGENIEYILKGESDRTISRDAISLDPKYAFVRGFAYAAKGDNDRSITEYSEAIQLLKGRIAYNNRGGGHRAQGIMITRLQTTAKRSSSILGTLKPTTTGASLTAPRATTIAQSRITARRSDTIPSTQ